MKSKDIERQKEADQANEIWNLVQLEGISPTNRQTLYVRIKRYIKRMARQSEKKETYMNQKGEGETVILSLLGGVILVAFIGLAMWLMPKYGVYQQRQEGMAILAHAQSSREVAVAEAKAKMESATLLAQAEVERAKGVAQANKIIGDSLHGNEDYLRYLWITDVAGTNVDKTVVYVPTETNLPILEASRSLYSKPVKTE